MASIRIIKVPAGEAPAEIRRAWVGLVLPLPEGKFGQRRKWATHGVLSGPKTLLKQILEILQAKRQIVDGYFVVGLVAVDILAQHAPAAAQWWRENASQYLQPKRGLVFEAEACEEIT